MRRCPLTLIFLGFLATVVIQPEWLSIGVKPVLAQRRRGQKPRTQPRTASSSVDYSKFLHATEKHKEDCSKCHSIPTQNWQKARGFPDVADYPDHEACVSCHRQQFFKGASPVICTGCHTVVSPKNDARLEFRNPNHLRQFSIEFPHDKHQDVIALLRRRSQRAEPVMFLKASMPARGYASSDEKKRTYNNCEICHGPRTTAVVSPVGGWVDGFTPLAETFKASPESHAACFNCHWKAQAPTNEKCDGCHKLAAAHTAADSPNRISMKFRHAREQHIAECTTCHINITKAASLRGLKPDVPITACSECHNKPPTHVEISNELEQLDKNRQFVCVYCHTSNVGSRDAPASHYLVAERTPVKRTDIK